MDPNLNQNSSPQYSPQVTNTQSPTHGVPKWLKIILIIFGVIALFVVVIFLVVNLTTAEPQKISDEFIKDIGSKDTSSAELLVVDEFNKSDLEKFINALPSFDKTQIIDKKISTSTDTGTIAVFIYKLSDSNLYLKIEVKKVGSVWKILNIRSSPSPLEATVE